MNIPAGFAQVFPYIFVTHADSYIAFLERALEAKEMGRTFGPDGGVANSRVSFGSASIMVSEASDDYPPTKSAFYLYVDDADASMEHAMANGAKLEMPAANMPYGDRQGGVRDPEGNIWWISQRLSSQPYD